LLIDLKDLPDKPFKSINRQSRFKKLHATDRFVLCLLLKLYLSADAAALAGEDRIDDWERAAQVMAEARALAVKLRTVVFQDSSSGVSGLIPKEYRNLPDQLDMFSMIGELVCDSVGKRGHKARIFANHYLVLASEFVRRRTGNYFDEQMGNLLQAIAGRPDDGVLSTEAIRKKTQGLQGGIS
jgi:hypothetical protein